MHDLRLNPWVWNHGYGGPTVKLQMDFKGEGLTMALFRGQLLYPGEVKIC